MSAPIEQGRLSSGEQQHQLSWVAQFLRNRRRQAMDVVDASGKKK